MARQLHTAVTLPSGYAIDGSNVAMTAADAANFEEVAHTGRQVILYRNSGATPRIVTVSSVAHSQVPRTGDFSDTVAAGEMHVSPMFPVDGWRQTNGKLYFSGAHAEVLFSVITIP
jgi:hypothetical protein